MSFLMPQPCWMQPTDPHHDLDLHLELSWADQDPDSSLSPVLEVFEDHSSSLPVLSQSSSVRREIGMERHLSECPGLEEDHEWELPEEHPERYLPECPGPEEGLEWKLSECPGHPERHLPECGVKKPQQSDCSE